MKTYREIKISHGQRKELIKLFNISYPTLRMALKFETDKKKAIQIREYALAHGGILLETALNMDESGDADEPDNNIEQKIISNNNE